MADDEGTLLPTVATIFVAEMFTSPLLRILDVGGQFKKHFQAPRAVSQDEMNLYFKGTEWSLAERYTDLTKILLLTFYYSYLLPMVRSLFTSFSYYIAFPCFSFYVNIQELFYVYICTCRVLLF